MLTVYQPDISATSTINPSVLIHHSKQSVKIHRYTNFNRYIENS